MNNVQFKNGDFAICLSEGAPFQEVAGDSTLYRKELIYPGKFVKRDADGQEEFKLNVDDAMMDNWVQQFEKMRAAGVEVPIALEHSENPERRRGTVENIRREYNPERKMDSLFMYGRFRDAETAELAKTSQVSLYSKPQFFDGHGAEYKFPITHVALTDYPLIPGLKPWQAIAASLVLSDETQQEPQSMAPYQALADRLGVSYEEGASEEDIADLIEAAWTTEDAPVDDGMGGEFDDAPVDDGMGGEFAEAGFGDELADDGMGGEFAEAGFGDELSDDGMGGEAFPASRVAASLVNPTALQGMQEARLMQLDALASMGKITPAERKTLGAKYADQKRVAFALSNVEIGDGFKDLVLSLSARPSAYQGERTPAQTHGDNVPAIVRDAERRAAKK